MNDRDFALLFGFDHYKSLKPLKGPIGDAEDFQKWLLDPEGGNIPSGNCFMLPSDPDYKPGQDDVDDRVDLILDAIGKGKGRRLYIFFAGHGFGVSYDNNGLLLPKWSLRGRNAAFSSKAYFDYFVESDLFEEVLLFLDCCRDPKTSVVPRGPRNGNVATKNTQCRSSIFYASEFTQSSYEDVVGETGLVRGNFSLALMRGLRGGAANERGEVTLKKLASFTKILTENFACGEDEIVRRQKVVVNHFNDSEEDVVLYTFPGGRPLTTLTVTFLIEGTYMLKGQKLEVLKEGTETAGAMWVIAGLATGFYVISEVGADREERIFLDNSEKNMSYEF